MILYNTIMGVCAGLALLLVPLLVRQLSKRQSISAEGWSLTFGILGGTLLLFGGHMAITWPLGVNPPINILFAEPTFLLGMLLLAASIYLWKRRDIIARLSGGGTNADAAYGELRRTLTPVSWIIFGLGLVLTACTLAIVRFGFVGGAPAIEPITGLIGHMPAIENTFFAVLYGLSAVGTLLAPWALKSFTGKAARIAGICMVIAGVLFLVFSAMNYYTHIGMLHNINTSSDYRW